jgi:hypothetical protein
LLDEQGEQIFATTDDIAERVRKIGGTTLRSIGHIRRLQRIEDNDAEFVTPMDMLAELRGDNKQLVARMRETHELCEEQADVATASLLEVWIDEAERHTWFCSKRRVQRSDPTIGDVFRSSHQARRSIMRTSESLGSLMPRWQSLGPPPPGPSLYCTTCHGQRCRMPS